MDPNLSLFFDLFQLSVSCVSSLSNSFHLFRFAFGFKMFSQISDHFILSRRFLHSFSININSCRYPWTAFLFPSWRCWRMVVVTEIWEIFAQKENFKENSEKEKGERGEYVEDFHYSCFIHTQFKISSSIFWYKIFRTDNETCTSCCKTVAKLAMINKNFDNFHSSRNFSKKVFITHASLWIEYFSRRFSIWVFSKSVNQKHLKIFKHILELLMIVNNSKDSVKKTFLSKFFTISKKLIITHASLLMLHCESSSKINEIGHG
jgi:hypothetical protein